MICKRCNADIPQFLWVQGDHPVLVERSPVKIFRSDEIENNMVKIVAEQKVQMQMCSDVFPQPQEAPKPNLGCATTQELLDEIAARIEVDGAVGGGGLNYRTVDHA